MNDLANDLNNLIDKFGFGVEFTKEDLFSYFESEKEADLKIKLLIENDLLNQDILSNNYYIADIFTCNNFLSEYLIQKEETVKETIIKAEGSIKANDFMEFFTEFKSDIEKIELKKSDNKFKVKLELKTKDDSIKEKIEKRGLKVN